MCLFSFSATLQELNGSSWQRMKRGRSSTKRSDFVRCTWRNIRITNIVHDVSRKHCDAMAILIRCPTQVFQSMHYELVSFFIVISCIFVCDSFLIWNDLWSCDYNIKVVIIMVLYKFGDKLIEISSWICVSEKIQTHKLSLVSFLTFTGISSASYFNPGNPYHLGSHLSSQTSPQAGQQVFFWISRKHRDIDTHSTHWPFCLLTIWFIIACAHTENISKDLFLLKS